MTPGPLVLNIQTDAIASDGDLVLTDGGGVRNPYIEMRKIDRTHKMTGMGNIHQRYYKDMAGQRQILGSPA